MRAVHHAHEEVYVAIRDAFDKLAAGDEVRLVAQYSESAAGPQASTVVPLGKHRSRQPKRSALNHVVSVIPGGRV